MYEINFDPIERILHLRLEDFWTGDTAARFSAEVMAKSIAVKRQYGSFATLSDSREFQVQSAETAKAFSEMSEKGMALNPGPTAVVVRSALNRLQAQHSLSDLNRRIFLDMDEAHAWLREVWVGSWKTTG